MKISEHLRNGIEIAKEAGIKQGKRVVFKRDTRGVLCEVCALGILF